MPLPTCPPPSRSRSRFPTRLPLRRPRPLRPVTCLARDRVSAVAEPRRHAPRRARRPSAGRRRRHQVRRYRQPVRHPLVRGRACTTGNTVEKFNTNGVSQGTFGSGYNCDPHALAFDTVGSLYVGQAHCTGAILKVSPGSPSIEYTVAAENAGSFWIDLAPDGCTIFYTSWGPDVKRFDVCTDTQLADFNRAPLPGGETHGLRVLPDGGVLVTRGAVVSRLDSTGALVQTYRVSTGEPQYWAGVDLVGDGTFWAVNYLSSNVYKFDLTTGAVLARFTTGTPAQTVVDVGVSPGAPR